MSRITGGAHPFPLARSRTAVSSRDQVAHHSPAGGRHDRGGRGEGEREEARRDVSPRSRRVVDEGHQPQPTHSSRSQSIRTPTSHRELRPIHTQPSPTHRTPLPVGGQQSVVRPSNPSRTVSHSSSSSSSQSSISSASSGASDSSSLESPVQATTSWKDWALGRGGKAVGETEQGGRAEAVVVELETKEDLSDLIAPTPKSTIWNIVSTAAHAAIHRGGAGESEFIGDDEGPPTPVGGEGKLERAMKRWYVENAASRSDLPEWLFPPSALAPPPPPAVKSTQSTRPSNDSVSRSRSLSSPAQPPRNLLRDIYDSAPPLPTARRAAVPLSTGGASSVGGGRATERLRAMRLERAPTRVREPEPMVMQEEPVPRRSGGGGGGGRTREEARGGRGGGGGGEERRRPVGLPSGPGGLPSGPGGRRAAGRFSLRSFAHGLPKTDIDT